MLSDPAVSPASPLADPTLDPTPNPWVDYDPNGVGSKSGNLFGLPMTPEQAAVVVIPVPWEVTVSYRAGTARGPQAILEASTQIDLYDPEGTQIWQTGAASPPVSPDWLERNDHLRAKAAGYIAALEAGEADAPSRWATVLADVNQASAGLNDWLEAAALEHLVAGKWVGVVGGDHSSPLGLMRAIARQVGHFSILHIDAHSDLRVAYEGFEFSHASIMHNAMQIPQIDRLVQVGIRDTCPAEVATVKESGDRILAYYDWDLQARRFQGETWHALCQEIVNRLSDQVYISFDIDGLDPALCPNTGTPVPGGLLFEEAMYLVKLLGRSGKRIVGFDLCEVAPGHDEWDGNVGARVLYRLVSALIKSQFGLS
jgi:agmatinase